ncbi:iron-sulfur cluster repair di-iron protein [Aquiflexum lacus]|uniref:iron-sulfur cluster repair di-iron protein n=1 Tax=Aquiflexum lacus TaxID=2483805 RepID=UPI001894A62D|nr:iron-sulfur cluster repair di-iron protein [Aquiflexum lacus]
MIKELENRKVGAIVAENFKTAKVFTQYGIDFCCKGGISLQDACSKNEVNLQEVTAALQKATILPEEVHYKEFGLSRLIDHIIDTHHQYVENAIPALKAYLQKLATVHGERHPELFQIRDEFMAASYALTSHMKKEELILFPYVKAMEEAEKSGFPLSKPHFGHIDNPINMMEDEHETEGERFRTISKLSDGYKTPSDGCQTYRVAFEMLKEFESDLHTHIHLENNILFPKATVLYNNLNS